MASDLQNPQIAVSAPSRTQYQVTSFFILNQIFKIYSVVSHFQSSSISNRYDLQQTFLLSFAGTIIFQGLVQTSTTFQRHPEVKSFDELYTITKHEY